MVLNALTHHPPFSFSIYTSLPPRWNLVPLGVLP
jgi:hypothetical protein